MIQLGTMVAAILVMSVVGATTNAKMATQTFPVLAGAGRTTSIPRPMVQSGSPRNRRANSAGSIPEPASRI